MFPGYDENQLHHDVSILRGYLERVFTWHFIFIAPLPLLAHFLFFRITTPSLWVYVHTRNNFTLFEKSMSLWTEVCSYFTQYLRLMPT